MIKKTTYRLFVCAALLLFAAAPACAEDVPVKIGKHDAYTRIVFEFPKLVAYHASQTANGVELTFDTPLTAQQPAKLPSTLAGFTVTRPDPGTLKVVVGTKGAGFKHYRLMRKIVLDVGAEQTAAAKPAPEKEAPPAQKPEEKPEEKTAAAPPAETPPPAAPAEEKPAEDKAQTAAPVADAAPAPAAEPVEPVAAEAVEPQVTKITLATVSSSRLAVFRRFGFLWIVADGQVSSAFQPEVDGPQAGIIGKPKFFRFGEGRAWRYLMPPDTYVSVEKKSLTWYVTLSPAPNTQKPASATVGVDIDRTSNKAKLMAQLPGAGSVINFEDPSAGDTLYVVATDEENMRVDETRRFPDADILSADMGFVLRPLKDGLQVNRLGDYVLITSPSGVTASSQVVSSVAATGEDDDAPDDDSSLLYNFPDWRHGGVDELDKNRRELTEAVAEAKTPADRAAKLMELAWLYFANNFGQETLGVLRIVEDENPDMSKTPDFIALKGAANAMAGHYPEAIQYLSDPSIQQHPEVNLWVGYAAAATEQWHKANESFPKSNRILVRYPDNIAIPFTLYMAESALRLGHTDTARALLGAVSTASEDFSPQYKAALGYLRGEALRQQGDLDGAVRTWQPVAKGIDRLYHAKASLALANLQLQQNKITLKEAIDEVDSLRFAWRGDGLEVQILGNLGNLKVQDGQYLSGLQDLQQAATLSENLLDDPAPLQDDMRRVFTDLFVGGAAQKISALEAVSVYNQFSSLMPPGPDSTTANLHFADSLINMDLLDKAEDILEKNLKTASLPDAKTIDLGTRLAAIYLLDAKAAPAIAALDNSTRGGMDDKQKEERALLRARAQSMLKQTDAAIMTLAPFDTADARKLKVDVLWRAQRWTETLAALEPMLPAPKDKLSDDEAHMVLNAAVAAKLGGDTRKMDDLKARYAAAMKAHALGSTFGVVTRDGGVSTLSDRETILKMAGEVDMFKGFLDNYKKIEGDAAPSPDQPPAGKEG